MVRDWAEFDFELDDGDEVDGERSEPPLSAGKRPRQSGIGLRGSSRGGVSPGKRSLTQSLGGGGAALPADVGQVLERTLGTSLHGVRVHSGPAAAAAAEAAGAEGFAYGDDV